MKLTEEMKARIKELIREGKSSGKIADELGVGKMQVAGIKAHIGRGSTTDSSGALKSSGNDFNNNDIHFGSQTVPTLWSKTLPSDEVSGENHILIGTDQVFNKKVYWNYHLKTGSVKPLWLTRLQN